MNLSFYEAASLFLRWHQGLISSNCGFKATKGLFGSIILLKGESFATPVEGYERHAVRHTIGGWFNLQREGSEILRGITTREFRTLRIYESRVLGIR